MSVLDPLLARVRRIDPEALLTLRPKYPPVAVEVERGRLTLVRVRATRRARPLLEAFRIQATPDAAAGVTVFKPNLGTPEDMARQTRELFELSGTKPGKLSLILPDNLAKVSIVSLPERPANRKQLDEMLRFKLRRSVPFKLEEAAISAWALPGAGPEHHFMVAVMMRAVVEQYEAAFTAAGARPGLVDLCTPSLFNLVRADVAQAVRGGSDAALLNCTRNYFTLLIARADRVVFYRCKTYAGGEGEDPAGRLAVMARELASSFSYYAEKLAGGGVGTVFVRAVAPGLDEVVPLLSRIGVSAVRPIDASSSVDAVNGSRFDPLDGQCLAPALGSALGRTGF